MNFLKCYLNTATEFALELEGECFGCHRHTKLVRYLGEQEEAEFVGCYNYAINEFKFHSFDSCYIFMYTLFIRYELIEVIYNLGQQGV